MAHRLVGYVRVSTKAGRDGDRFLSPELQRADMERWASSRCANPEWVAWHVEIDRTATTQARPVLSRALEDAERSGAALVVFALFRWARNVEGGLRDMDRKNVAESDEVALCVSDTELDRARFIVEPSPFVRVDAPLPHAPASPGEGGAATRADQERARSAGRPP